MIKQLSYIETASTNPYANLALEETLLLNCQEEECILYLWQNRHTVVVGRNQNAWKECLVEKLQNDDGYLVRRLSGGGAVYHDLGNLNFTFLVRKENYDLDKQLDVIIRAADKLNIHAEKSGRNDILAEGKKFSGNAFYEKADRCYHHGTIMVNVNLSELSKYLNVSAEKLKSNGVDSVKSRVTNLSSFVPTLSIIQVKTALRMAFEEVYGLKSRELDSKDLSQKEVALSQEKFKSWGWTFGRRVSFTNELSHRFPWGELTLQLQVNGGKIRDVAVYSDAMKEEVIVQLAERIRGCSYDRQKLCESVKACNVQDRQGVLMQADIITWLLETSL